MSQMVNLLEMCLTTMDDDIPSKGVLHSTISAVNAVHKVYVGMQVQCFFKIWSPIFICIQTCIIPAWCMALFRDLKRLGGRA